MALENQQKVVNSNVNKQEPSKQPFNPAIMKSLSLDSISLCNRDVSNSKECNESSISWSIMHSTPYYTKTTSILEDIKIHSQSFLLIDNKEFIRVSDVNQFLNALNCTEKDLKVKVVSIFGNTGDGKSYTLNHTFFDGQEVFTTSNEQDSCTLGVWAAFDPKQNVVCLDTEGLLGITIHDNERTRMLLKVFAVSDIIVYRTRSERLHKDMFTFLAAASRAYSHHFQSALQAVSSNEGCSNSATSLGPSVIIFHETRHTLPLIKNDLESPEDTIRKNFAQSKLEIEAYSSIKYIGIKTVNHPTDFRPFQDAIIKELQNTTVRSARKPQLVFETLKILNDKFSGKIENCTPLLFPDQYFTCQVKCYSCKSRCEYSMGHVKEGKEHHCGSRCRYQHQFENLVYLCKKCYSNGSEVKVTSRIHTQNESSWYGLAKYAWSGYVIECPNCGEIYRSRQYWYGNQDPEDGAVRTEIIHVWNVQPKTSTIPQNTAQKVVDSVSYLSETVANYSLQPKKILSSWVADQVAPSYWRPNNEIIDCYKCHLIFDIADAKHHCRSCGEGFCAQCSSKTKCVPERNWFTPVRVCNDCYEKNDLTDSSESLNGVNVRKVSEQVVSTINVVGSVLNYSKTIIKDTVRPSYWIPDSEVVCCCVCEVVFSDDIPLHHCRDCGKGVCQDHSQKKKTCTSTWLGYTS